MAPPASEGLVGRPMPGPGAGLGPLGPGGPLGPSGPLGPGQGPGQGGIYPQYQFPSQPMGGEQVDNQAETQFDDQ